MAHRWLAPEIRWAGASCARWSHRTANFMPHIIRLREPWERERLDNGTVRLTRRFHRPTGLDAKSRVWLVVEHVEGEAEVGLNEQVLGRVRKPQ